MKAKFNCDSDIPFLSYLHGSFFYSSYNFSDMPKTKIKCANLQQAIILNIWKKDKVIDILCTAFSLMKFIYR